MQALIHSHSHSHSHSLSRSRDPRPTQASKIARKCNCRLRSRPRSSSLQRDDDGRMSHAFSQVQCGFSVTKNNKQIVRSIKIKKKQCNQVHCLNIIVNVRVTSAISITAIKASKKKVHRRNKRQMSSRSSTALTWFEHEHPRPEPQATLKKINGLPSLPSE